MHEGVLLLAHTLSIREHIDFVKPLESDWFSDRY
jgi:hypothetical protein